MQLNATAGTAPKPHHSSLTITTTEKKRGKGGSKVVSQNSSSSPTKTRNAQEQIGEEQLNTTSSLALQAFDANVKEQNAIKENIDRQIKATFIKSPSNFFNYKVTDDLNTTLNQCTNTAGSLTKAIEVANKIKSLNPTLSSNEIEMSPAENLKFKIEKFHALKATVSDLEPTIKKNIQFLELAIKSCVKEQFDIQVKWNNIDYRLGQTLAAINHIKTWSGYKDKATTQQLIIQSENATLNEVNQLLEQIDSLKDEVYTSGQLLDSLIAKDSTEKYTQINPKELNKQTGWILYQQEKHALTHLATQIDGVKKGEGGLAKNKEARIKFLEEKTRTDRSYLNKAGDENKRKELQQQINLNEQEISELNFKWDRIVWRQTEIEKSLKNRALQFAIDETKTISEEVLNEAIADPESPELLKVADLMDRVVKLKERSTVDYKTLRIYELGRQIYPVAYKNYGELVQEMKTLEKDKDMRLQLLNTKIATYHKEISVMQLRHQELLKSLGEIKTMLAIKDDEKAAEASTKGWGTYLYSLIPAIPAYSQKPVAEKKVEEKKVEEKTT